jgi:hypothetical protein
MEEFYQKQTIIRFSLYIYVFSNYTQKLNKYVFFYQGTFCIFLLMFQLAVHQQNGTVRNEEKINQHTQRQLVFAQYLHQHILLTSTEHLLLKTRRKKYSLWHT